MVSYTSNILCSGASRHKAILRSQGHVLLALLGHSVYRAQYLNSLFELSDYWSSHYVLKRISSNHLSSRRASDYLTTGDSR